MSQLPLSLLKTIANAFTIAVGDSREMQSQHSKVISEVSKELDRRSTAWMPLTLGKPVRQHGTGPRFEVLWLMPTQSNHPDKFEIAAWDSPTHLAKAKAWATIPAIAEQPETAAV